jgi:hypothetical protein
VGIHRANKLEHALICSDIFEDVATALVGWSIGFSAILCSMRVASVHLIVNHQHNKFSGLILIFLSKSMP